MKLTDLLCKLEYECIQGSTDLEIGQVVYDSRKIAEGCLFICIRGANFDGHDFAAEAVEKGARALVVSQEVPEAAGKDVTVIRVPDTRYALAFISAAYFGDPETAGDRRHRHQGEDYHHLHGEIHIGKRGLQGGTGGNH